MATFLTIGYGDAGDYEATDPARRDKAHAHDRWLASQGAVIAALGAPTQVRNPEGGELSTTRGAYMHADLPLVGFALLEAENLEEAIERVAGTPCAIAQGVVEVWPVVKSVDQDEV
ncbi:MAG TPA: YciI family protein [Acidimicrobiales bacterium]|nr:YciI family protein [Acidimicrobiales bacterium]